MQKIQEGYIDIPYHNAIHGFDVSATCYYFIYTNQLKSIAAMSDIDIFAMIAGGAAHDFRHPGFSANFLINTGSNLAI